MENTELRNVKRKLDELKRITGLSLHIELPETENAAEHDDDEFLSYTLHQLDALIDSYKETKEKVLEAYADRKEWAKKTLVNIAKAGFFSSDRTIEEYNRDIWHL